MTQNPRIPLTSEGWCSTADGLLATHRLSRWKVWVQKEEEGAFDPHTAERRFWFHQKQTKHSSASPKPPSRNMGGGQKVYALKNQHNIEHQQLTGSDRLHVRWRKGLADPHNRPHLTPPPPPSPPPLPPFDQSPCDSDAQASAAQGWLAGWQEMSHIP